ncbi:MAG TPA: DUF1223 domain-containing protein [Candidatus Acidoferrum sp.]|nr:DUF1223 domain-containing protein [Candidatus Acidoferrum sp.]
MRTIPRVNLRLCCALLIAWSAFTAESHAQTAVEQAARKPVVIELFTSEGCSSCPPADVLLQKLEAQQPIAGAQIIAIEEHVDYWNHDGWTDPYSSAEWTKRQQTYVALHRQDAYTPEFVIDGRGQFVANNAQQAEAEIEKASSTVKTEVSISAAQPDAQGSQRFNINVGKLAGSKTDDIAEVWIAVTEDGLHSSVSLGENAGHVLHHTATLRALHKIGVADAGAVQASFTGAPVVKLNSHWDPKNVHVTVFVQEKKSREILGAASTKVKG